MQIADPLTAYQLDRAVTTLGAIVENALAERKEVKAGKTTHSQPVYTLDELLEDEFRLPRPPTKGQKRKQGAMNLLSLAADPRSGIKMWRELPKDEGAEKAA